MRRHGERYLPQFKERVIAFSRDHSFIETAKQFHVHHTTVSEWVRERDKGKEQVSPAVKLPTPEDRFREWLEPLCFGGTRIEKEFMLGKAQEIISRDFGNDWFSIWVKRVSDEERKSDGSHLIYPVWFKNCVCIYTKNFNQNESVKLFALSRKRISEWMQSPDQQPKPRGCKDGRAVTDTKIDQELVLWVQSEFKNEKIKGSVVCRKAQELYSAAGYKIACSKGWFAKWCQRHNLSASPRVALDSNLEDQLIQWTLTQFDRLVL